VDAGGVGGRGPVARARRGTLRGEIKGCHLWLMGGPGGRPRDRGRGGNGTYITYMYTRTTDENKINSVSSRRK
jgi:hypothetical protein